MDKPSPTRTVAPRSRQIVRVVPQRGRYDSISSTPYGRKRPPDQALSLVTRVSYPSVACQSVRTVGLPANDVKALAHRREAPRLGNSELDSLLEDFDVVADRDVPLAAGPGVEG